MNLDRFFEAWAPRVLGIVRLIAGLLLVQHGMQKLFGMLGAEHGAAAPMTQIWVAGVLEFFGGLLLAIGLFTRPVAFILCGLMAVAYFQAHAPQGFIPVINKGELAVIYCFVYLLFVFTGPGPWSLDALIFKKKAL